MPEKSARLFVYGTLMPGEVNHHYLKELHGVWQKATVTGQLYPEGIGLAAGYPALVLDEAADLVPGWLLQSDELEQHWQVLDEFEGSAYQRVITTVTTEDNDQVKACVYVLFEGNDSR